MVFSNKSALRLATFANGSCISQKPTSLLNVSDKVFALIDDAKLFKDEQLAYESQQMYEQI